MRISKLAIAGAFAASLSLTGCASLPGGFPTQEQLQSDYALARRAALAACGVVPTFATFASLIPAIGSIAGVVNLFCQVVNNAPPALGARLGNPDRVIRFGVVNVGSKLVPVEGTRR